VLSDQALNLTDNPCGHVTAGCQDFTVGQPHREREAGPRTAA
jgi:hypothetical protein